MTVAEQKKVELTDWQARCCATPEGVHLALLGGRGSGKTTAAVHRAIQHLERHKANARIWVIRRSFPGLADIERDLRLLFADLYGSSITYSSNRHLWTFDHGGTVELGMLESDGDFQRWQGRSATLIIVDEAQSWADPSLVDRLRSCLRSGAGVPCSMIVCANPGGGGQVWLHQRFFRPDVVDWVPFQDDAGETWVRAATATLADNANLPDSNLRGLVAAASGDRELLRAWVHGDFTARRGAFFGDCLDRERSLVTWPDPDPERPLRNLAGWEPLLAYDHGSAAPAVCLLLLHSLGDYGRDGRYYPKGSIVVVDEISTAQPGSWTRGDGSTVPMIAGRVKELARRWGVKAAGVADPSAFSRHGGSAGSIAEEFRACGVGWEAANNDRASGWSRLRSLMAQAGDQERAGLYIDQRCNGLWTTLPMLPRSPRNVEDVDTEAVDHWADALRYGVLEFARGTGGSIQLW